MTTIPEATHGDAQALTALDLPLPHVSRGKVREMFALGDDLLLIATDRLSAFDIVFDEGIPDKGRVLTGLSDYWFDHLEAARPHHRISTDVDSIVAENPALAPQRATLLGRTMRCIRARPIAVECVVRGYLDGSGWREYHEAGSVAGIPLLAGLRRGDELPEPIFTPATKAAQGHDVNISYAELERLAGAALARRLSDRSLALYLEGREHARNQGIILADTKFEFGWGPAEQLLLIDEVLTPDSSRFWDAAQWSPGGPQPSFDKQPIRDFLEGERESGRWNGEPPLPDLPDFAIAATSERYREAYRRIVGRPLPEAE
jgi:phosphoribosylaminoimidazole-succinocarboxamide synthase